jgi:hypothetical protein
MILLRNMVETDIVGYRQELLFPDVSPHVGAQNRKLKSQQRYFLQVCRKLCLKIGYPKCSRIDEN